MQPATQYLRPLGSAEFKTTVRGSKFLGAAEPIDDVPAAQAFLAKRSRRHHDATHHCWAYRIAGLPEPNERSSDAGEPSGTAGRPILESLRHANLIGVVLVVSRWFGGTKLGKGGLARAYADCAAGVILLLRTEPFIPTIVLEIECTYGQIGIVERAVAASGGRIISTKSGATAKLQARLPLSNADLFAARIADASSGSITISK